MEPQACSIQSICFSLILRLGCRKTRLCKFFTSLCNSCTPELSGESERRRSASVSEEQLYPHLPDREGCEQPGARRGHQAADRGPGRQLHSGTHRSSLSQLRLQQG